MKNLLLILILSILFAGCSQFDSLSPNKDYQFEKVFSTVNDYESFISGSEFQSKSLEEKIDYFESDNGMIKIGPYFFRLNLKEEYGLVTENENLIMDLINLEYDNPEIQIFSSFDDALGKLEANEKSQIQDLSQLKEYNELMKKQFTMNSPTKVQNYENAVQSSFTFTTANIPNFTLASNANLPFTYGPFNCGFEPGFGFPNGPSNNTNLVWRFVDFNRSTFCDQAAYFDIIYIRAIVYFELKTRLNYIRNNSSFNNSSLTISNSFSYERRRRFASNQIITGTNGNTASNTSELEVFIYSGSRSLGGFQVQSTFTYDVMPNCCSTQTTSRQINTTQIGL